MKGRPEEPPDSDQGSKSDAALFSGKVFEGGEDFLEVLTMRLNEIIQKPNGRFVISYVAGQPGSKTPPRVQ